MRKWNVSIAAFLITFAVSAQEWYPKERALTAGMVKAATNVGDFTITDTDGVTWNLYQQLNQGKTVFIDLFFTT